MASSQSDFGRSAAGSVDQRATMNRSIGFSGAPSNAGGSGAGGNSASRLLRRSTSSERESGLADGLSPLARAAAARMAVDRFADGSAACAKIAAATTTTIAKLAPPSAPLPIVIRRRSGTVKGRKRVMQKDRRAGEQATVDATRQRARHYFVELYDGPLMSESEMIWWSTTNFGWAELPSARAVCGT